MSTAEAREAVTRASRCHRRRPAPADLHLLPPGARDGDPPGADAAHGGRPDRARDRPSFLVQETAMGQRITRAKAEIKAALIPYRVPSAEDLPARVSTRPSDRQPRGAPPERGRLERPASGLSGCLHPPR